MSLRSMPAKAENGALGAEFAAGGRLLSSPLRGLGPGPREQCWRVVVGVS